MKAKALLVRDFLEYLGGSRDAPPAGVKLDLASRFWAFWWLDLIILILFFSGQTSKFVYIDF